jgi:hypothetical protein
MSLMTDWRRCGAPGCARRVKTFYFCCAQHRSLLGYELSVRLQTDWRERTFDPARFERTKGHAFRAWGWQPETLHVGRS